MTADNDKHPEELRAGEVLGFFLQTLVWECCTFENEAQLRWSGESKPKRLPEYEKWHLQGTNLTLINIQNGSKGR